MLGIRAVIGYFLLLITLHNEILFNPLGTQYNIWWRYFCCSGNKYRSKSHNGWKYNPSTSSTWSRYSSSCSYFRNTISTAYHNYPTNRDRASWSSWISTQNRNFENKPNTKSAAASNTFSNHTNPYNERSRYSIQCPRSKSCRIPMLHMHEEIPSFRNTL